MRWAFTRRAPASAGADRKQANGEGGSLLRFILALVVLAWALRSFIVAPFSIPSGSMLPTLYVGDYLVVAKWPYGYSRYSFLFGFPAIEGRVFAHLPKRGDVVVFRHPSEDADLIKRVIGLPGDMIEVRGGELILNGRPVSRQKLRPIAIPVSPNSPCKTVFPAAPLVTNRAGGPRCLYPAYRESLPGGPNYAVLDQTDSSPADDFPATRVPAGHVFLMGDNRDDSLDSRYPPTAGGIGLVPVENLVGRALVTFWSTDGSASYVKPWTWFAALRARRIGNGYAGVPQ